MKLKLATVGVVLAGALTSAFLAGPSVVKAVATFTKGKFTHVTVSEERLRILKAVAADQPADTVIPLTLALQGRDGVIAGTPYVVPAGRVFIATDVFFKFTDANVPLTFIHGWIGIGTTPFASFSKTVGDGASTENPNGEMGATADFHFVGGVPYNAGSSVTVASPIPSAIHAEA